MSLSNKNEAQGVFGYYLAATCDECGKHRACLQVDAHADEEVFYTTNRCAPCLRSMADSVDAIEQEHGGIDPPDPN